jgi:hypothetical protein
MECRICGDISAEDLECARDEVEKQVIPEFCPAQLGGCDVGDIQD